METSNCVNPWVSKLFSCDLCGQGFADMCGQGFADMFRGGLGISLWRVKNGKMGPGVFLG